MRLKKPQTLKLSRAMIMQTSISIPMCVSTDGRICFPIVAVPAKCETDIHIKLNAITRDSAMSSAIIELIKSEFGEMILSDHRIEATNE